MPEPWTVYLCSCGELVAETYEYRHQGEGHDGGKPTRVVLQRTAADDPGPTDAQVRSITSVTHDGERERGRCGVCERPCEIAVDGEGRAWWLCPDCLARRLALFPIEITE